MIKKGSIIFILLLMVVGCGRLAGADPLDQSLQQTLEAHNVQPLDPGPVPEAAKVKLGQALFFDKELSGNRDIACATCHHPSLGSGDELPVSIGTGGNGLGVIRQIGYGRSFIPRNAPDVFNRGATEWRTMFWDSRVFIGEDGYFYTPAGDDLPDGLDNILAAQAMFPVTSGDEMRGASGDTDIFGNYNELAVINENDLPAIWDGLMARILSYPEYVAMFQAAYPGVPTNQLGFQHAANAIAAFEISAYTLTDSPWDRYLAGDTEALSEAAKRGAILFYGEAGCGACHSGPLFTDQAHHVVAAPQVGPGKGDEAPWDLGRSRETGDSADWFAFRTPPLRNVSVTGPWMHDGAFSTLEAVVRHHLNPIDSLLDYDPTAHLPPELQHTYQNDPYLLNVMIRQADDRLIKSPALDDQQVADLVAFLEALTDPAVRTLTYVVPDSVPSGLPVTDELPPGAREDYYLPPLEIEPRTSFLVTGTTTITIDGEVINVDPTVLTQTITTQNDDGTTSTWQAIPSQNQPQQWMLRPQ